jgi:arylsulfatase A-like enzyme
MAQKELLWGKSGEPTGEDYLTDDLTVQADRFIRSHHEKKPDQPFLLYFCEFAVHTPHQAKQADIDYFTNKTTRGWNGHHDPVYASVLRSLDQSVGRLMDTVEELALTDDTLFIFMSDNGGVSYITKKGDTPDTSNAPLKGGKASLFEGGIRVPLIFKWPKIIPAGAWSDIPVAAADLFPTIVQAGGIAPATLQEKHRIDGRSLMPLFNDPENKSKAYPRDTFYWHYPFNVAPLHTDDEFALTPHSAMRKGDMKIIYDWNGRIWLHDIRKDPYEKTNLAETLPDLTKQLFRELNDWLDANVEKKYMPALNPNYDPAQEVRPKPFKDLRRELLGPDHAIRPAKGDPRLESLLPAPISK